MLLCGSDYRRAAARQIQTKLNVHISLRRLGPRQAADEVVVGPIVPDREAAAEVKQRCSPNPNPDPDPNLTLT